MRFKTFAMTVATILCFAGAISLADNFKLDDAHSSINFRVQHAKAGFVFGRFDKIEGMVVVDDDPAKMKFDVSAQTSSVDTGNAQRDTHLKSPTFFSAKEFPTISFKSTSVKSAGDDKFEVTGDVTVHGVTKPMTVTITRTGSSDTKMGKREGFLATFSVKRSDFGMTGMTDMIGDDVELTVALEVVKQ